MYDNTYLATLLTPRLVADAAAQATPHSDYDGGFILHFDVGTLVTVELVGKGFESADLTSGRAVHESYTVLWPWSGSLRTRGDLQRHSTQQFALLTDPQKRAAADRYYADTYRERQQALRNCGASEEAMASVPYSYVPVSDTAVERMLNDALRYIGKQPCFLESLGLRQFLVQGEFIHNAPVVWTVTPLQSSRARSVRTAWSA